MQIRVLQFQLRDHPVKDLDDYTELKKMDLKKSVGVR